MCGITGGVWYRPDRAITRTCLDSMTDALTHRGPDDRGIFYSTNNTDTAQSLTSPLASVGLGFRRLSIIDLDTGHQPLGNEDGSIQIVFNGEIYNYRDLRRRLEGAGHQFATQSDTETIVHLYEDLGLECFAHLNGMFAIAIWDSRKNQLVLARDRMGKKPLYYAQQDGRMLFASELKSLMCVPDIPKAIDPGALDLYFTYQYIPHPWSIYDGIRKMVPGEVGVYQNGSWETKPYWSIDWQKEENKSRAQAIEEVRELLTDSVRLRLRSDVPLGAFLSGGVDSSLIVAIAQRQLDEPIRTFSIGFTESEFDETRYAQLVADLLHTEHCRFEVTPDALSILDKLVYHYDEPFSDSSAVPTWYLCEQTRKKVTVALSGDGGDELFAGYDRYKALQWSEHVQRFVPHHLLSKSRWLQHLGESPNRQSFMRRVKRFSEALGQPPAQRYMRWLQIFGESQRLEMYREDFIERLPNRDPFQFLEQAWNRAGGRDLISKASVADLQTYLPCDLMTKVDIASMAHGLEARQPFLDYRMVEFAASLPVHLKYRWRKGKRLLEDAFGDMIPKEIWRRPKMGFGIPLGTWFRGPLRKMTESLLLDSDARCHAYLRPEFLQTLMDNHFSNRSNEGYRLWNLLSLELWLRRWA
ncbi:MAG: asparagine synthase (glutamine-hydrolyzing) [Pirellulaceae bacterium]|nr:asparagine synthase (glutamine-hydrolyzing) [Pirellulaceae bacterium]